MSRMTAAEFRRLLDRDGGRCPHCGTADGTLVPGHRYGRQMGGSRMREVPSNVMVQCWALNNGIETDPDVAEEAERLGWRLRRGQKPGLTPFWHRVRQEWVVPDDEWNLHVLDPQPANPDSLAGAR